MYKYVVGGLVACGLVYGEAVAAPITGAISFSDGGITLPAVPSNSIVHLLDVITQNPGPANSCVGEYAFGGDCDPLLPVTAGTIDLNAPGGTVYTYGNFTFDLIAVGNINRVPLDITPIGSIGLGTDALTFSMFGTVTEPNFDPTPFVGNWTGNGACIGDTDECLLGLTASWSASLISTDRISVPEPESLALLGIALIGFGLLRQTMTGKVDGQRV